MTREAPAAQVRGFLSADLAGPIHLPYSACVDPIPQNALVFPLAPPPPPVSSAAEPADQAGYPWTHVPDHRG